MSVNIINYMYIIICWQIYICYLFVENKIKYESDFQ